MTFTNFSFTTIVVNGVMVTNFTSEDHHIWCLGDISD